LHENTAFPNWLNDFCFEIRVAIDTERRMPLSAPPDTFEPNL
jgi:hypothetical protein